MRLLLRADTKWEKSSVICDKDIIIFSDAEYKLYFNCSNNKIELYYRIDICNEEKYKEIKRALLIDGFYDLAKYQTYITDGKGDWECVNSGEIKEKK